MCFMVCQKNVGIVSALLNTNAAKWRQYEGKTMNAINKELVAAAETSSYHAIKLLMDSALNYMQEAADAFDKGDGEAWCKSIVKAHSFILGLRASLDMNQGAIADNLDSLYEYMTMRLNIAFEEVDIEVLAEVYGLLEEVKIGWDGIENVVSSDMAVNA